MNKKSRFCLVLIILSFSLFTTAGCGGDERVPEERSAAIVQPEQQKLPEPPESKQEPATQPHQEPPVEPKDGFMDLPYKEWLKKVIAEVAGKEFTPGRSRIKSTLFYDETKTDMEISLWADDNLTPGLIRDAATIDSALILRRIFDDPRAKKVTLFWWYPLKNAAGQEIQMLVIRARMTRETADKINWGELMPLRLPDVADDFHVHPSMQ